MGEKKIFFVLLGIGFILALLSIECVFADFSVGNKSEDIAVIYGPSQALRGWINISLGNEAADSLLTAFAQSIKIYDFLLNNSETKFNCTPSDCKDAYETSSGEEMKSFSMNNEGEKILGLRFQGKLNSEPVQMISFKVESDANASCSPQLKIDIGEDNELDWIPVQGWNDYCTQRSWGCYNNASGNIINYRIETKDYCEKILVPASPFLIVGAEIIQGTTPNPGLKIEVYDIALEKLGECLNSSVTNGEISCRINISFLNEKEVFVCVKAGTATDYQIKGESSSPCGFFDIDNYNGYNADYSIFAQAGKYAPIGAFSFDENSFRKYENNYAITLKEYLNEYLMSRYGNECSNGCVIPIKFISSSPQTISISNLSIRYSTDSGVLSDNKIYDVNKIPAKISSYGYLKLELEKANFTVSSDIKNETLVLKFGEREILRKTIEIRMIPEIKTIVPLNPPALVAVDFVAIMERSEANMTYIWNFGDNSSEISTTKNIVKHAYPKIGSYKLTLKVLGKNGETSKTFNINAVSPKSVINQTFSDYRKYVSDVENQIKNLPEWIKIEMEKKINLSSIKEDIDWQEKKYSEGFIDDNKAVEIMSSLLSMKIPTRFYTSKVIKPSAFFMSDRELDIDVLENIGAGTVSGTQEQYYKAIMNWIRNNINATFSSESYSVSYADGSEEDAGSYISFNLEPKKKVGRLFFVVRGEDGKIKFRGDLITDGDERNTWIEMPELEETKTIEFLHPEKVDVLELPVYISPEFKYLSLEDIEEKCNFNEICDKDIGENYKNCSDCEKPWFAKTLVLIILLIIGAFIVYIILQEWYKRNYEKHLFSDRNKLFNVINFMNNSLMNGLEKEEEIFKKLKETGWSSEQLDYAWKKLHGKRTGMFEIPVFKIFENKKLKNEINKRQGDKF